jgi:hypothetical protein
MKTKTGINITKEQFLSASLSDISTVYSGKSNCCRCGCQGDYTDTSYGKNSREGSIKDNLVEKRLKRAKKLIEEGAEVMYGDTFVDVTTGEDRTLTFYFDDLKN